MPKQDARIKHAREDRAYTLWLRRATIQEVMDDLKVKKAMAYRLIQRAEQRAAEQLKELEGQSGVRHQFAILVHVQREGLEGYERSKLKKTKSKTSTRKNVYPDAEPDLGGDGLRMKVGQVGEVRREDATEQLIGDVRFLDLALKSTEQIRELLGLDPIEVRRILVSGEIDKKTAEDLMSLSDEQLQAQITATLAGT